MKKQERELKRLLGKYNRNQCTPKEKRRLQSWFLGMGAYDKGKSAEPAAIQRMLGEIKKSPRYSSHVRTLRMRRILPYAAAISLLFLLMGGLWLSLRPDTASLGIGETAMEQVEPGGDRAFLTLGDGSRIVLADAKLGILSTQQGTQILKDAEGILAYNPMLGGTDGDTLVFNTIETPRGGQYQLTLPDGSRAWLNAGSVMTFPVQFSGRERIVKVQGEIYFEVNAQERNGKRVPFVIASGRQRIEVLGTHFNVSAYDDELFSHTTLVEGKVRVTDTQTSESAVLMPGQQGVIGDRLEVRTADLAAALAWKNGDFLFRNEELYTILQKVSRWYNIEVECPEHLRGKRFYGAVSRKQPLSAIVKMIESTGEIKLKLVERRLIVET